MGSIVPLRPFGRFRAVTTRDAEALRRDGAWFVALNWLPSSTGDRLTEIQFADGVWMLAGVNDLELR